MSVDEFSNECKGRRHFLKVLAVAAATPSMSVALGGCGPGAGPVAVGDVAAGNVADLAVGTLKVAKPGEPVCIGRDAGGLYAMTLTCTHEGCDISTQGSVSSSGISCNCHGSRFDANGNVVRGPARDPLQHFAVSVDAQQNITIHGDMDVSSSTRTAV